MINIDYDLAKIVDEVDKITRNFLQPINIAHFQFKRTYKNKPPTILANSPAFFKEFVEGGFIEPETHLPLHLRQSYFCFWDETLSENQLSYLTNTLGIYHGLTILSRRKDFYDCISVAMSERIASPVAYYLLVLKELQSFADFFPIKASNLIKEVAAMSQKLHSGRVTNVDSLFLPQRSIRFYLGKDPNNYITTYEALCAQLIQQGKSYKEVGSILSMGTGTVKTYLARLKARTGLSVQEISVPRLQSDNKQNDL